MQKNSFTNVTGVQPTILLKIDCFIKVCAQIYSFCGLLLFGCFSFQMVKKIYKNILMTTILLYLLIYTILINTGNFIIYFFLLYLNQNNWDKNFLCKCFGSKGSKNLFKNNVKALFSDFKFPKYFRQKCRLLIIQNYFTSEIRFPYFLVTTLKNLRQFFISYFFSCRSFAFLGLLLFEIFRIVKFLLIINFTTTKLKSSEQQKIANIKQHCVENNKHQKLLGVNVYNILINLFKTNVPTETIHLVCLNQITGFWFLHESNNA